MKDRIAARPRKVHLSFLCSPLPSQTHRMAFEWEAEEELSFDTCLLNHPFSRLTLSTAVLLWDFWIPSRFKV